MPERCYFAIDLKSFYASVECVERGLDPLTTHLVVADPSRTDKTICLAVSPSLKACGISGRPRYFEVLRQVEAINAQRRLCAPGRQFSAACCDALRLAADPSLSLDMITAVPRMALYIEYSARIYDIYLNFFSPDDIHVYSIDEVFIDATAYLKHTRLTAHELTRAVILAVLRATGVTAAAGIGTNLYLAKVAMDIMAKKVTPDEHGVRIAFLDEAAYRRQLWDHTPLRDFWRVGKGYASKLERYGIRTMGDLARHSLHGEDLLFRLFGVNAELLIDHAWGCEPCTMADIKTYQPASRSLGSGQVLHTPYDVPRARLVVWEMADLLALELVEKRLATDQLVLTVGYDKASLDPERGYTGEVVADAYGRLIPRHAHGTTTLERPTSSGRRLTRAVLELFDRIVDTALLVRRVSLAAGRVLPESQLCQTAAPRQLDLLTDYAAETRRARQEQRDLHKERRRQEAILKIRQRYGKNALLKGLNLEDGATTRERNQLIGGHKA
ncbi:MAG TPA: DNA methylase [Candidatus Avidesulfovibrio excrementigallinarum]|nr:DNA methylase [Candidatus Avidesulfovibrio excrementigallinarum]